MLPKRPTCGASVPCQGSANNLVGREEVSEKANGGMMDISLSVMSSNRNTDGTGMPLEKMQKVSRGSGGEPTRILSLCVTLPTTTWAFTIITSRRCMRTDSRTRKCHWLFMYLCTTAFVLWASVIFLISKPCHLAAVH